MALKKIQNQIDEYSKKKKYEEKKISKIDEFSTSDKDKIYIWGSLKSSDVIREYVITFKRCKDVWSIEWLPLLNKYKAPKNIYTK